MRRKKNNFKALPESIRKDRIPNKIELIWQTYEAKVLLFKEKYPKWSFGKYFDTFICDTEDVDYCLWVESAWKNQDKYAQNFNDYSKAHQRAVAARTIKNGRQSIEEIEKDWEKLQIEAEVIGARYESFPFNHWQFPNMPFAACTNLNVLRFQLDKLTPSEGLEFLAKRVIQRRNAIINRIEELTDINDFSHFIAPKEVQEKSPAKWFEAFVPVRKRLYSDQYTPNEKRLTAVFLLNEFADYLTLHPKKQGLGKHRGLIECISRYDQDCRIVGNKNYLQLWESPEKSNHTIACFMFEAAVLERKERGEDFSKLF